MTRYLVVGISALLVLGGARALANDWPQWRGPEGNGISRETKLPSDWDPDEGTNVAWHNEQIAGMSSPIIMNGKLYTWTRVGEVKVSGTTIVGPETREALVCADAKDGKILWQHKVNMFQTEVPFHRLGWGNVAGDPKTNRVYGYGTQGTFVCLDANDGKVIWQHAMLEEYGQISTFGGRTQSPLVDEDQVFLTGVAFGWGDHAQGQHRIFAFDKMTGQLRWTASTGGRPVDAPQGTPAVAVINGQRLVAFGAGDGGVYGFQARTGKKVFGYVLSKRGINTSVMFVGNKLIAGSSEENFDTPTMGRVVSLDVSQVDPKTLAPKEEWRIDGLEAGFASPTAEPDGSVVYMPDNKGTVHAIDLASGKVLWKQGTKTIARPSLVWADGKIYAAEANGNFFIIRPPGKAGERAKVLSKVEIASDAQQLGREYYIFGSPAVSDGRIYLQTAGGTYCIGPKQATRQEAAVPAPAAKEEPADPKAEPAVVQVVPADEIAKVGEKVSFKVRTYDEKGRLLSEDAKAEWSMEPLTIPAPPSAPKGTPPGKAGNLRGTVENGVLTTAPGPIQAGAVTATMKAGGKDVKGFARVRVMPEPPYHIDFELAAANKPPLMFVNVGGKFQVREMPDKNKVLVKTLDLDLYHLARCFFGRPEFRNYTVEADVMTKAKWIVPGMVDAKGNPAGVFEKAPEDKRAQRYMPDIGVVASRYTLVMYGIHQQAMLIAWTGALPKEGQLGGALHKVVPFKWEPETWYHMKLSVQGDETAAEVRGKIWKKGEAEPAGWLLELKDPAPNRSGSPGLFGESLVTPYKSEIYYDNIKVTPAGNTAVGRRQ